MREQRYTCPMQSAEHAGLLLDFCAQRLTPPRLHLLEAHFEICPDCRKLRDEQRALWTALELWDAEPVSLDFNRRLFQTLDEPPPARWRRTLRQWAAAGGWKPAVPALAVAACWILFVTPAPPPATPLVDGNANLRQVEVELEDLDMLRQLKLNEL